MDKEMSRKIGGAVYSEFESFPHLQTWFDVDIPFWFAACWHVDCWISLIKW